MNPNNQTPITIKAPIEPGVKGWLLLLCISLVFIVPLRNIYNIVQEWSETYRIFNQWPTLQYAVYIETVFAAINSVFAIAAGLSLWRIRPQAVVYAKTFMFFQLLNSLLIPWIMYFMLQVPDMIPDVLKMNFQGTLYFSIWFTFLVKSKRVQATYPTQAP